jgi:hypothetical protein
VPGAVPGTFLHALRENAVLTDLQKAAVSLGCLCDEKGVVTRFNGETHQPIGTVVKWGGAWKSSRADGGFTSHHANEFLAVLALLTTFYTPTTTPEGQQCKALRPI